MKGLAFISYRREDTGPLAEGLYLQLKGRFGSGQLFMDVNSMPLGSRWPQRVQDKLHQGHGSAGDDRAQPGLLRAINTVDGGWISPDDWVRLELGTALVLGKPIISGSRRA